MNVVVVFSVYCVHIPYLVCHCPPYLVCHCPPCSLPLLTVQAVLAELQQAGVITGSEGMELGDISAVVKLQSKNSPEVMVTTAEILRRHEFEKESEVLSGWLAGWLFVK